MATTFLQREEDGSIPTANPAGLSTSNIDVIQALGRIGDGAFGTTTGDFDFYHLGASVGSIIAARTVSAVFGLDTEVRIYNSAGTRLAFNNDFDGTDSFVQFAVPATDSYFVAVSRFKAGNPDPTDPFNPGSGPGSDTQPPVDYRVLINKDDNAVTPTAGADTINGNGQANLLVGGGGVDIINGMGGPDVIEGGTGNDTLSGGGSGDLFIWRNGDGTDIVNGGANVDKQDVFGSNGATGDNFTISASGTTAVFARTNLGLFQINTTSIERMEVFGLGGNDTVTVNDLAGTALVLGPITLRMGDGNDVVNGAATGTRLILDGGLGNDTLTGGTEDDTFIYAPGGGADTVTNFAAGTANFGIDHVDLRAFSTIQSFADVLALSTQVGADTVVNFGGGNTLTLQNVQKSSLFSADFGFPAWLKSPVELADFGWAQGWTSPKFERVLADFDNQGSADYVGFGASQVTMAFGGTWNNGSGLGSGFKAFAGNTQIHDFTPAQGYDQTFARGVDFVDLSQFDRAVWGQGNAGLIYYVPIDSINDASVRDDAGQLHFIPQYDQTPRLYREFGHDQGWNTHHNFDVVFVNDSFASILGFGAAGLRVGREAFAPTADASQAYTATGTGSIGNDSGWDSVKDIRAFKDALGNTIDLNLDGIADFVGMGPNGLQYATGLIDAGGKFQLNALQTAHVNGGGSDFGEPQGWNNENTIRYIADLNRDGRADILGFGAAGAFVSLGQDPTANLGEAFGQIYLGIADFGFDQGWLSPTNLPRVIGDVNGDAVIDIVGFGNSSTFTALGRLDGTGKVTWAVDPTLTINDYGQDQGWNILPTVRELADVDGDARSELVLSGAAGTHTWDLF